MPKYTDKEIRNFELERMSNGLRYGFQFGKSDIEHVFEIYEKLREIKPGHAVTVDRSQNKYNAHYIRQFMINNDWLLDQTIYALQWYLAHGNFPKVSGEVLYRDCSDEPEHETLMDRVNTIFHRVDKEEEQRFRMQRERMEGIKEKVFELIAWVKDRDSEDPIPTHLEGLANNRTMAELYHFSRHSKWPDQERG